MLKTAPAWSLFLDGVVNSLILIAGALAATLAFALAVRLRARLGLAAAALAGARCVTVTLQSSPIVLTLVIAAARAALLEHVEERSRERGREADRRGAGSGLGRHLAPVAFEMPIEALPRIEVLRWELSMSVLTGETIWGECCSGSARRATGSPLARAYAASRASSTRVVAEARVGNVYVNRSMIGAVDEVRAASAAKGFQGADRPRGRRSALLVQVRHRTHADGQHHHRRRRHGSSSPGR